MKASKIYLLIFIVSLFINGDVFSQGYTTGVGPRIGGLMTGLSVKQFICKASALEGIISAGHKSVITTVLYEQHSSIDHSGVLNFYYGAGMHVGFFKDGGRYYSISHLPYNKKNVAGIDIITGIDYKFPGAPVNFSMDLKPFLDFFNGSNFYFDGGLTVRYTF